VKARSGTGLTLVGTVGHKGEYTLRSALVGIGSDPSNQLVIDEPTVSRRHAEVVRRSGVFEVRRLSPLCWAMQTQPWTRVARRSRPVC